ncbi:hypothetical protein ACFZCY_35535 [Streptomyces sp. NPDC007983]|uniref:hypothetical protein n=1 Tax=Streptomyces sp. NPDC007983 TaxID=3364800 RepID=UPI0036E9706A
MINSISASSRFGEQTGTAPMRSTGRSLVIEDLDAAGDTGSALLSICVVAAPVGTAVVAAPIRFE